MDDYELIDPPEGMFHVEDFKSRATFGMGIRCGPDGEPIGSEAVPLVICQIEGSLPNGTQKTAIFAFQSDMAQRVGYFLLEEAAEADKRYHSYMEKGEK